MEIGLRLSRSCTRQHVFVRASAAVGFGDARRQGELGQGRSPGLVRFFATKNNPGYSVVSGGSPDEGMLFKEKEKQLEWRRLVLYSKPGCCLCDALKEKLLLAFMLGGENDLSDIELEVRDITTNDEWEKLYQYEIPVLRRLRADASEETIPRFSPRLTVEQLQKKLAAALDSKK